MRDFALALCLSALPLFVLLALAGFGSAIIRMLPIRGNISIPDRAVTGVATVVVLATTINFVTGLGTSPGLWTIAFGLVLFVIGLPKSLPTQLSLIFAIALILFVITEPFQFGYDTGLYQIPSMNWIAFEPAPFGLTNLEGRLGFNSTWLILESAFRISALNWTHLIAMEHAARILTLAWIGERFIASIKVGDQTLALVCLLGIGAAGYISTQTSSTATDPVANLFAICAWVSFCHLLPKEGETAPPSARSDEFLLPILVALAVTFKFSMTPIILLLALLPIRWWAPPPKMCVGLTMAGILGLLWLARNFVLSGCLVFPVALTCAPVLWQSIGRMSEAGSVAGIITAWARHPGNDVLGPFFDTSWLPKWFAQLSGTVEFITIATAAAVIVLALAFGRRSKMIDRRSNRIVYITAICSAVGILFWFLAAPDPRLGTAFFLLLIMAPIFWMVHSTIAFPIVPHSPISKSSMSGLAFLLGLGVLIAGLSRADTKIASPPVFQYKSFVTSEGWTIYAPASGDQCWDLFPCTPYGFHGKKISRVYGRPLLTVAAPKH